MWREDTRSRHVRYKKILSESWCLYEPAITIEKESGLKTIKENRQSVMLNTTTYVLGPAVSAYVLWFLGDAVKKGY